MIHWHMGLSQSDLYTYERLGTNAAGRTNLRHGTKRTVEQSLLELVYHNVSVRSGCEITNIFICIGTLRPPHSPYKASRHNYLISHLISYGFDISKPTPGFPGSESASWWSTCIFRNVSLPACEPKTSICSRTITAVGTLLLAM